MVSSQAYGHPLSTVFSGPQAYLYDEENDPTISYLQYIDYRYLRFFYHPLKDKFVMMSGWKDPLWTNVKVMRTGLDAEDRDSRELVFGKNLIEIQQKSFGQLLVDEVSLSLPPPFIFCYLIAKGFSSILCLPNRESYPLVTGCVLLLCGLHLPYFCF